MRIYIVYSEVDAMNLRAFKNRDAALNYITVKETYRDDIKAAEFQDGTLFIDEVELDEAE